MTAAKRPLDGETIRFTSRNGALSRYHWEGRWGEALLAGAGALKARFDEALGGYVYTDYDKQRNCIDEDAVVAYGAAVRAGCGWDYYLEWRAAFPAIEE